MYETEFVRKKKRKIRISIVTGISAMGVAVLAIVAFLGRYVGTFTVKLNTGSVELTLSQTKSFENPTTYLMIDSLPLLEECTYRVIDKEARIDDETLHYNDIGPANVNGEGKITSLNYFKYTFYVKNTGNITAGYDINFNILENALSDDNRSLLDTLRVAVYDNEDDLSHKSTIYAKASPEKHIDDDGNETMKEYVSVPKEKADDHNPYYGLAEMFDSDSRVCKYTVNDFKKDDIKRYTIVCWLEGNDLQSDSRKLPPKGAKVKLGVEINAYENQ